VDAEDFADICLKFKVPYCNLHLNIMSHDLKREISIDFEDRTIIGDLVNNKIFIKRDNKKETINFQKNEMYVLQLAHFFKNKKPMNELKEAEIIFKYVFVT